MLPGSGRCDYHPARPGVGVCVECRKVVCAECSTQVEGINRCASCLAARAARAGEDDRRGEWSLGNLFWAAAGFGAVCAGVYLTATLLARA